MSCNCGRCSSTSTAACRQSSTAASRMSCGSGHCSSSSTAACQVMGVIDLLLEQQNTRRRRINYRTVQKQSHWHCCLGFSGNQLVKSAATTVFLAQRSSVVTAGGMLLWSRRTRQPMQPSLCSWSILSAWRQRAVPSEEHCHPSVLWCCWLGDRKDIRRAKVLPQQFQVGFCIFGDQPGVT